MPQLQIPTCMVLSCQLAMLMAFLQKVGCFVQLAVRVLMRIICVKELGGAKLTRAPFEIKGRATLAFRGIGCGFSGMNDWCCVLPNLSEMRLKTLVFYQIRMEFLKLLCI